MSSLISFHKLHNTRDLGGMQTTDGRRIRAGRLFRSGQLYEADADDRRKLEEMLDLVVDLRTEKEQSEKPDPDLAGVEYCFIPALDLSAPGVTRDEQSMQEIMRLFLSDPDQTRQYMCGIYTGFIETRSGAKPFGDFIRLLLTEHDKGILWHCTAGKDRAGFAAVIIEEILGVRREEIMAEYMASNGYLNMDMQSLYGMAGQQVGNIDLKVEQALQYLFTAQEVYLSAAYAKAEELFGGMEGYITGNLGVTEEEKERLKELYLE
ncbi:MAG: tyrosine-protein phosphatase [Eubacterium sp.]|nr:tyrosine-protein phosphatase [Eubacterium sp.]